MPSGAKKRKAAKKKKENLSNFPNSHLGGTDQVVHEEKDSDGGETNSPQSQDHHSHFAEGEDKREEDTSSIQSAVTESESVEGVNGNGESSDHVEAEGKSSIQIDREIKLGDDTDSKTGTIEQFDFEKKSSSSSSSSDSRSSSDDESKFVDKNIEVIDWEEPIDDSPDLPAQAAAVSDLEKTSDLPESAQVNDVVPLGLAAATPDEGSYVQPAELSEITDVTEAVPLVDNHDSVVPKSEAEPVILSNEEVPVDEDLGLKVNGKSESSGVSSGKSESSEVSGSQSKVDIISSKEAEDGEVRSIEIIEEKDTKVLLPQSSDPAVDIVNGTEHNKDTENESSDKQAPVALPPRPVQTTSSMGCCGLFELFTGSNR